ncbi:MAG: phenylalanine--tRNA ligase subunit beta, partial [Pseudomonadales bacterium]|nr:phenylalanine--tRNA ligase subunit beta [Pseudomonadales bacterium]
NVIDPANEAVGLANPLSADLAVMRTTLWSGLLKALVHNLNRQQHRVRLFETGMRFIQMPNRPELSFESIQQEKVVAGVVCGARREENWCEEKQAIDFYDVKGDLEAVLSLTGAVDEFSFAKGSHAALHPGQCAEILRNGEHVGYLGMIDPRVQQQLEIDSSVYVFELKLDQLEQRTLPAASQMSRFPEVRRDISIVVDEAVSASEIKACVKSSADETLKNLKLFDVYRGKGIDPNRKSIGLGLTFQDVSRTLTDEETNAQFDQIVSALRTELDASLRD